ncbi:hypothetical protein BN938_1862 [Mucinivorans hirudinis]|uniref:Lipoprotein n=1 Tax=Mucinivorans hirudinis TaxID=1433126 RepID=A0A060R8V7_9BACT|nr:hypothetical protein BN938_1862 [Mucinivorans hirudinis]
MKTIKYALLLSLILSLLSGCTKQRDLYVASSPILLVKNDWQPSRTNVQNPMATLMVYPLSNPKIYMEDHRRKTLALDEGEYNVLVFNDYMYSESETQRNYIRYRGTDGFDSFEAYVTPMMSAFRAQPGEVIVNNPDTLATRSTIDLTVEGKRAFVLKYKNGKNGFSTPTNYIEDSLEFVPCRVVLNCVVIVNLHNVKALNGVGRAKGSLRGFSGSNFLASRMPGHSNVTHQFNLNGLRLQSETEGTISATFSTFGPPLDLPERKYELEITVQYPSGREPPPFVFDVTNQLTAQIARLNAERLANKPIMEDIIIRVDITLENDKADWDVSLDDWGDAIIIPVPF